MYFRISGGFKSEKNWVRTLQIRKLQKINGPQIASSHICGRPANLKKSANLLICDLRNLFADHPPLI
jgi:hypothetical protein